MKRLVFLLTLTGCLDLHDHAYSCNAHDDCVDGESCNEEGVCQTEQLPADLKLTATVRDGRSVTIEVNGAQSGFGSWTDNYPQNIHMTYGTLAVDQWQWLQYAPHPHPELTFPYVDVGSYDIAWASNRPPLHIPVVVTVTADAPPIFSTLPVNVLVDTRNAFDVPVSDADDTVLSAKVVGAPMHGVAESLGGLSVAYIPDPGYMGPDQVAVTVNDGTRTVGGVVHLDVSCGTASPDAVVTTWADTPLIDVRANDMFVAGELTITVPPPFGTASVVDGLIEYDPPRGYIGTTQFAYTISQPGRCAATAMVAVSVRQPVEIL
ncbi:MAG TPA: Ig-like domain-containing protein, partial [Kofleriaceae bacterium]